MHRYRSLFVVAALIIGCSTSSGADAPSSTVEDEPPAAEESAAEESAVEESDEAAENASEADYPAAYDKPPPYDRDYDISEVFNKMCAGCHGEAGDGDGPDGNGLAYDTPADEWNNGPTIDGILLTLEDGVHGTAMRDFPEFKNVDREKLAEYVLDLRQALIDRPE
ncbi:MAG: c-type cytochrome [Persicimonas sp.]